MTYIRVDLTEEQIHYLLAKIEPDVIAQGDGSEPWHVERGLDGALLAHELATPEQ